MNISIKSIAKLANCSTATVSNVLNNKGMFSAETKEKIMKIVRKHKYTRNAIGRNLRTGKSETIGITFCRQNADIFQHQFYLVMMSALERVMAENNYEIILSEYTNTMQERKELPPFLAKGKVDGMIVLGGFPKETIKLFTESTSLPVVMLDTFAQDTDCVITDGKKALKNAMREISKLGHTHVEFFGFSTPDYNTDMRIQGFIEGVEEFGFDKRKCKIHRNFGRVDTGVDEFKKMLAQKNLPSVVIASNDNMAIALMNAAKEAGINVPAQMSFVGFDDTPIAQMASPQLTTIKTDISSMGSMAANIILQKIREKNSPRVVEILEPTFVLRQSLTHIS